MFRVFGVHTLRARDPVRWWVKGWSVEQRALRTGEDTLYWPDTVQRNREDNCPQANNSPNKVRQSRPEATYPTKWVPDCFNNIFQRSASSWNLMLVAKLANTKSCKKLKNYWNPGTWVLIWENAVRAIQWIPTWQSLEITEILAPVSFGREFGSVLEGSKCLKAKWESDQQALSDFTSFLNNFWENR